MTKRREAWSAPCPCGSGACYGACCRRLIVEGHPAVDALALMRSRYAAFVVEAWDYLLATWHPSTRPERLDDASRPKWIGLEIRAHAQSDSEHAMVEFVARYRTGGRAGCMHEESRFVRIDGRWFYVDGTLRDTGVPAQNRTRTV